VRGLVLNLDTPHPLGPALPSLYQEDKLAQRFMSAFDVAMAPIFCTLDNLDAYFDPYLAPADFLTWLGTWVGLRLDENWSDDKQRALVAGAAGLFRWRGTARALAAHLTLYLGTVPEIRETGSVTWSALPGTAMPTGETRLEIVVRVPDPSAVDLARIHAIIVGAKPAHVPHTLRVEAA
jgi:phage tail-like protein